MTKSEKLSFALLCCLFGTLFGLSVMGCEPPKAPEAQPKHDETNVKEVYVQSLGVIKDFEHNGRRYSVMANGRWGILLWSEDIEVKPEPDPVPPPEPKSCCCKHKKCCDQCTGKRGCPCECKHCTCGKKLFGEAE